MDKLEKYIHDHRDEFDAEGPSDGAWDKISKNLDRKKQPGARMVNLRVLWQAAAAVVIFVVAYLSHDLLNRNGQQPAPQKAEIKISKELQDLLEADSYYQGKIEERKREVFQLTARQPDVKHDVQCDLAELDSAFIDLKNDLKDNADNEEVVTAMIQNYRIKLEILETLLEKLKRSKENTNEPQKKNTYEL